MVNIVDALAEIMIKQFKLVITEVVLDGKSDRVGLVRQVKEVSPFTFVVVCTAYNMPGLEEEAYAARANFWLPKPYPLNDIEAICQHVFRGKLPIKRAIWENA